MRTLLIVTSTFLAAVMASDAFGQDPDSAEGIAFFETKIRPVLVEHCCQCHSAEAEAAKKLRGGLRLDTRVGLRAGGDSGPAIVAGKPNESVLIGALRHGDLKMPPKGKLPDSVIADFVRWIEMGAPDPRTGGGAVKAEIDWAKAKDHWAFQPVRRPDIPAVKDASWVRSDIDRFVLAELDKQGMKPVSPAERRVWLRRVTFALIGLPPTPNEIDSFERDDSPEAFEKVVDRLLDSPHYGERWARHWLDLARYTDDLGGTVSPVLVPDSYRYRDWVIQAFNRDMPYDRFVRLQLAGDVMDQPKDPFERLAGLGFQGLGQRFSGNAVGMVKKKIADELDDRVDTVTRSLLGLTVACARCHDHKFDPIPTSDYYALASAYNGALLNATVTLDSPRNIARADKWSKEMAAAKARRDELLTEEIRRLGRAESARLDRYLLAAWTVRASSADQKSVDLAEAARRERLIPVYLSRLIKALESAKPASPLAAWSTPASSPRLADEAVKFATEFTEALAQSDAKTQVSPEADALLKVVLVNDGAPFKLTEKEIIPLLPPSLRKRHDEIQTDIDRIAQSAPPTPLKAPGVSGGGTPMRINVRGNPDQLGAEATPGFLHVLQPHRPRSPGTFTRLDLADAIASADNPLTARVWVNRVWHSLFGRGIVATPSNFGLTGDRPTHPALLDFLAAEFVSDGWSTKRLQRRIVLSATYRLGSVADAVNVAKDPDNRFLWRSVPRRLDVEAWRDAMLAVSGTLDPTVGGPSLRGKTQLHPEDPENRRRTLYSFISRFKPNPTLTLFDFPEPNVTSDQRNATTIPQQQLFALNSPFVLDAATALAVRIESHAGDDDERLRYTWRLAFGRPPTDAEARLGRDYLAATSSGDRAAAWRRLCHSLLTANEFAFIE